MFALAKIRKQTKNKRDNPVSKNWNEENIWKAFMSVFILPWRCKQSYWEEGVSPIQEEDRCADRQSKQLSINEDYFQNCLSIFW